MAPGHVPYDLQLLESLHLCKLDSIFIRVPPCGRADLCKNWRSFFQDYYKLLLLATNSTGTSVYIRQHTGDVAWSEWRVSGDAPHEYYSTGGVVLAPRSGERLCFRRALVRGSDMNERFRDGLSASAVALFRRAVKRYALSAETVLVPCAYLRSIASPKAQSSGLHTPVITFAYRGPNASRRISNAALLLSRITTAFPGAKVQLLDTSHASLTSHHQLSIARATDVMIATHGAFVTNVIYMRRKALFVELRGNYTNENNNVNFDVLAKLFGVALRPVTVSGLTVHDQDSYRLADAEIAIALSLAESHLLKRSWRRGRPVHFHH